MEKELQSIKGFYDQLRLKIIGGNAVENKLANGQLTTDTLVADKRGLYQPSYTDERFMLATKNTMSYLSRLDDILNSLPEIKVIALVRNPFDTIASWINSFEHLRNADVESIPVGSLNDQFINSEARQRLEVISDCRSLPIRRALLWSHLANLMLSEMHRVTLIRYEEFSLQPMDVIRRSLELDDCQVPAENTESNKTISAKRHLLSAQDIEAIKDNCAKESSLFGYDLLNDPISLQ